jgi:hypothetical protein
MATICIYFVIAGIQSFINARKSRDDEKDAQGA